VAGFIGSPAMTFGHYSVDRSRDRATLVRGEVRLEVDHHDGDLPAEVVVGVRPEHTRLWSEGTDLLGPFSGRVEFLEALGRETLVGVVADAETWFIVQADGQFSPAMDEIVRSGIERHKIHLFDPASRVSLATPIGVVV
jgi:multiple sugar transport system ATP-binding protein